MRLLFISSTAVHEKMFESLLTDPCVNEEWDIRQLSFHNETYFPPFHPLQAEEKYFLYVLRTWWKILWKMPRTLCRLFSELKPDLVILGNDTFHPARSLIRFARRRNVRTLLWQDGFVPISSVDVRYLWLKRWLGKQPYGYGGCDYLAVPGSRWEHLWESRLVPFLGIHVCGLPHLSGPARDSLGAMACHQTKKIVFFCSNYRSGLRDECAHRAQLEGIRVLHQVLAETFPDFVLVVKGHPTDRIEDYFPSLHALAHVEFVFDPKVTLEVSSIWLAVSDFSSAVLHALTAHRPVLCLENPALQGSEAILVEQFPWPRVRGEEMLRGKIQELCSEDGYAKWLERQTARSTPWIAYAGRASREAFFSWLRRLFP